MLIIGIYGTPTAYIIIYGVLIASLFNFHLEEIVIFYIRIFFLSVKLTDILIQFQESIYCIILLSY